MRRSAAPSQQGSNYKKKPCFRVPYANTSSFPANHESYNSTSKLNDVHDEGIKLNTSVIQNDKLPSSKNEARSTLEVLKLLTKSSQGTDVDLLTEKQTDVHNETDNAESSECIFKNKQQKEIDNQLFLSNVVTSCLDEEFYCDDTAKDKENIKDSSGVNEDIQTAIENRLEDDIVQYFSVMWSKLSKKKHKKWEGDGIMIVKERTAILQDLEGKEISRRSGFKLRELQNLDEGQNIIIGSKECEIQCQIEKKDFLSGKCFLSERKPSENVPKATTSRPFVPTLKTCKKSQVPVHKECPKFSVNSNDALVMPRPSNSHQWTYNKNQLPVTDVSIHGNLANQLRAHQKDGIIFLYECILDFKDFGGCGAILVDEMGLGKTLQCIALIWMLHKQGPYGGKPVLKKTLIITPSSLVKNWLKEFHKWLGKNRLPVFTVDKQNKVQDFIQLPQYSVLLISYEMFLRNHELLSKTKFDLVVCDEGHRLKNTSIKTTNIIMGLQTSRRIVLTGTPVQNDLQEFYSIVEFCNPGVLGSPAQFHRIFEKPIVCSRQPGATPDEKELGNERAEELFSLTSKFILRRTQEIITKFLPKKVEHVVFCRPSVLQVSLYKSLLQSRDIRRCLSSYVSLDGCCHLMCIAAIRKLCNHPLLLYSKEIKYEKTKDSWNADSLYQQIESEFPSNFQNCELEESSGKLKVLSSLLAAMYCCAPREKIVLVSCFTQTLDILQQFCINRCYKFLRLDGSTPTCDRQGIVEKFNSSYSDHFVFLLSSKAGGVGLNLIGASRILLFDIDWNPANDLQAMARVWRDGQNRQVYIYRLITAGTIEEKIFQRQITKQNLSGAVIDCKSGGKVKFSLEDLKDLFSFQENAICSTHDLLNCHCLEVCDSFTNLETNEKQDETDLRSCQLRGNPAPLKKAVGMAELLKWDHIPGTLLRESHHGCDSHLSSCQDDITFIFCNKMEETTNDCKKF